MSSRAIKEPHGLDVSAIAVPVNFRSTHMSPTAKMPNVGRAMQKLQDLGDGKTRIIALVPKLKLFWPLKIPAWFRRLPGKMKSHPL